MGLYASFTPEDLGLPSYLETELDDGDSIEVEVDYSDACDAFCEVFLDVATSLVPVDTGYLQSTISADTDGFECEVEATAEYAQYVEYGTWKMAEQPYFEPAIEEALEAFMDEAQVALDDAYDALEEVCESIVAPVMEGGGLGLTVGLLGLILAFPVLVNLYGILETLFNKHGQDYGVGSSIEVIIT